MSQTSQQSVKLEQTPLSEDESNVNLKTEDEPEIEAPHSRDEQLEKNIELLAQCIYFNDERKLQWFLTGTKDKNELKSLVNSRDATGKCPLENAACLGRVELAKLLISYGADVNNTTSKGYNCLHLASAWGQRPVLEILAESGGNTNMKTVFGETPRDIAVRYKQVDCVEFFDMLVERNELKSEISQVLLKLQDLEKTYFGKAFKDGKNIITEMCQEKLEWLFTSKPSSVEIAKQHSLFLDYVQNFIGKLSETCIDTAKAGTTASAKKGGQKRE